MVLLLPMNNNKCQSHGANIPLCTKEGCTKHARSGKELCQRHCNEVLLGGSVTTKVNPNPNLLTDDDDKDRIEDVQHMSTNDDNDYDDDDDDNDDNDDNCKPAAKYTNDDDDDAIDDNHNPANKTMVVDDRGMQSVGDDNVSPSAYSLSNSKNGILFRLKCNQECYQSSLKKCCSIIEKVSLDNSGDYALFLATKLHCGYYQSENIIFFTAQLFCDICNKTELPHLRSLRSVMQPIQTGKINVSSNLSNSVCNNWDTDYPVDTFPPPKKYQLQTVDCDQNRVIERSRLEDCKHLSTLVQNFESKYQMLNVQSVWLIRKEKQGDGFQQWHQDKPHNSTTAYTIVVNLGSKSNYDQ